MYLDITHDDPRTALHLKAFQSFHNLGVYFHPFKGLKKQKLMHDELAVAF